MSKEKSQQKIHIEQLQATLEELEQLEEKPKEELSLRESIYFLRDQIKKALTKGYSYSDISQLLEKQEIRISAATLKQYISEMNKESGKGKRTSKGEKSKRAVVSKTTSVSKSPATQEASATESKTKLKQSDEDTELKADNAFTGSAGKRKSVTSKKATATQKESEQKESNEPLDLKAGKPSTGEVEPPKFRVLSSSSDENVLDEFNQY